METDAKRLGFEQHKCSEASDAETPMGDKARELYEELSESLGLGELDFSSIRKEIQ